MPTGLDLLNTLSAASQSQSAPSQSVDAGSPTTPNPFDQFDAPNPFDRFDAVKPQASSGLARVGLGLRNVMEGVAGVGDFASQAVNGPVNAIGEALGVKGHLLSGPGDAGALTTLADKAADAMHLASPSTPAENVAGSLIRGGTGGLLTGGVPGATGAAETGLGLLLRDMAAGVTSAGSSEAAKAAGAGPLGQLAAGVVGGFAPAGAEAATLGAGRLASRAAEPFVAAKSAEAAQAAAARALVARASDPEAAAASLEPGPSEIVPGSVPTTFQQTGDAGLGALEREVATRNPAPFAERRGEQNAARVQTLKSVQEGGDPNDVANYLKGQFDDLDATTQAHVTDLTEKAQTAAAATGGAGTPEDYGEQARSIAQEAEDSARSRERGLWKAIDPENNLTGNTVQTSAAAKEIASSLPPTAKPMSGEEAGIFNAAAEMPALSPVNDLIALRSRVSTEMRTELIANGNSPTYARLSQLRNAIQDNLASSVGQQIANETSGVARGAISPDDTIASKLRDWVNAYNKAKAGTGGAQSASAVSEAGAAPNAGPHGAGLPPEGGLGASDSSAGLPGDAEPSLPHLDDVQGATLPSSAGSSQTGGLEPPTLTPTFDDEAATRLAAATVATKARARTFGAGPVGDTVRKAGASDLYRLPDGRVPGKFFHTGPTGYSDMKALYNAVGEAKALPVISDYAASSLRKAAVRDDGTMDPVKYARWINTHADSVRALPAELRAKFSNAASATQAVADAAQARTTALKTAQSGAIGKIMGLTDPTSVVKEVGRILESRMGPQEMARLVRSADSPEAKAGLRQAVVDHIMNRYIGNTEAGVSGVNQFKADAFQTFVKSNRSALGKVLTPAEVNNIAAIAEDINRSNRSLNGVRLPGGSNTAQDILGATRGKQSVSSRSVLDIMGTLVGGVLHGPIGAVVGGVGAHALQAMRQAGVQRVDDILTQAMLHPAVARELLKKAPIGAKATENTMRPLVRSLIAVQAANSH